MTRLAALAVIVLAALSACAAPPAPPPPVGEVAEPVSRGPRQPVALGETCGGMTGLYCADAGAFCQIPPDGICGAADATGICAMPPQVCTREYRPVCGCDGNTYPNACNAAAASTSVAYEGACTAG